MTYEEVLQAIRSYVITATGLDGAKVYVEHTTTAPPPRPCVSVHLRDPGRQRGVDGAYMTQTPSGADGAMLQRLYGTREATVVLSAYGVGGYDLLEAVRRATHTESGQERALELGLSVVSDAPRSVPAMIDGQAFEERFLADVRVSYTTVHDEAVQPVDVINGSAPAGEDFQFSVSVDTEP